MYLDERTVRKLLQAFLVYLIRRWSMPFEGATTVQNDVLNDFMKKIKDKEI